MDLDCTSPLRNLDDIKGAVELIESKQISNVFSAMYTRRSPYFNLVELTERGYAKLSKSLPVPVLRRQDSPKCYDMNASIYVWKHQVLMNSSSIFNEVRWSM